MSEVIEETGPDCDVADICPEGNDCKKCEIEWYEKMLDIKNSEQANNRISGSGKH